MKKEESIVENDGKSNAGRVAAAAARIAQAAWAGGIHGAAAAAIAEAAPWLLKALGISLLFFLCLPLLLVMAIPATCLARQAHLLQMFSK